MPKPPFGAAFTTAGMQTRVVFVREPGTLAGDT